MASELQRRFNGNQMTDEIFPLAHDLTFTAILECPTGYERAARSQREAHHVQ